MIKGLKHLIYEERLRDLGFSAWRSLRGDLITVYKNAYCSVKWMSPDSFQQCAATGQRTMDKNYCIGSSIIMRKNLFTVRVTEHWNRQPKDVVASSPLEVLKTHLDTLLCNVLYFNML